MKGKNKGTGRSPGGTTILVGGAGEHYVIAELLYRGIIAGASPRNSTPYDILATDRIHNANIRVKCKSAHSDGWQFKRDDKGNVYRTIGRNDFTVLVALRGLGKRPAFFIMPTRHLNGHMRHHYREFVKRTGGKRPKSPDSKHAAVFESRETAFLGKYRESWRNLGLHLLVPRAGRAWDTFAGKRKSSKTESSPKAV